MVGYTIIATISMAWVTRIKLLLKLYSRIKLLLKLCNEDVLKFVSFLNLFMHCKMCLEGWISSTSTSMARTATCQGPCSCWCSAYSFVGIGALGRGMGVSWWWPWRKNRKCYCGIFEQEDVERASCIGQHCFCLQLRSRYGYWMIHHTQCSQSCSQWIHNYSEKRIFCSEHLSK